MERLGKKTHDDGSMEYKIEGNSKAFLMRSMTELQFTGLTGNGSILEVRSKEGSITLKILLRAINPISPHP